MAYIPLHQLRIPSGNVRRAGRAALAIPLAIALVAVGTVLKIPLLQLVGTIGLYVAPALVLILAVPVMVVAVCLLLLPFAGYLVADFHYYPILRAWWFWIGSSLSVLAGILLLIDAGHRYPKR